MQKKSKNHHCKRRKTINAKKESKNHHCKGRQIIDAGGADGEGQWSGKAAALLAQMQNNYSQGNT